jgi:hypothetical protein
MSKFIFYFATLSLELTVPISSCCIAAVSSSRPIIIPCTAHSAQSRILLNSTDAKIVNPGHQVQNSALFGLPQLPTCAQPPSFASLYASSISEAVGPPPASVHNPSYRSHSSVSTQIHPLFLLTCFSSSSAFNIAFLYLKISLLTVGDEGERVSRLCMRTVRILPHRDTQSMPGESV